jgi:hypothetical protein
MPHPLSTPNEIYRVALRSTYCSPEEAHTYALGVVFEAAGAGVGKLLKTFGTAHFMKLRLLSCRCRRHTFTMTSERS